MPAQSIQYLRREEIDIARWDQCIDASPNGLIYAYSFYLDHMSRHWDALVCNDYEAVMPLTWNKKFGFYYLYQPPFTASLGVFGKTEMVQQMLDAIPPKFRLIEIEMNNRSANSRNISFAERTNFVLDLSKPYDALYANYRENLQRNIKKSLGQAVKYSTDIPIGEVLKLSQTQMQQVSNYTRDDFENFKQLFNHLHKKQQAITCGVHSEKNELLASAVFFFSHRRAYYILVGNRVDGTGGASHYLLDRFIHDHAGKNILLDFEGSDISGLAYFYSSFGAVEEKYWSARANRLPALIKWLKSKT